MSNDGGIQFWILVTWFGWIAPSADWILNVAFTLSATGLFYAFYNTWNRDPGTITRSLEEKYQVPTLPRIGHLIRR